MVDEPCIYRIYSNVFIIVYFCAQKILRTKKYFLWDLRRHKYPGRAFGQGYKRTEREIIQNRRLGNYDKDQGDCDCCECAGTDYNE